MTDSVDALLGPEDIGDYDLRDDEEDALLEDDEPSDETIEGKFSDTEENLEESTDILDLNDNDEEVDELNYSTADETTTRDKFTSERIENIKKHDVPDTTSNSNEQTVRPFHKQSNRGRFPRRTLRGGNFHGGSRGRPPIQGYQNIQKNFQQRPEGNKYYVNPHFKGNPQLQNEWNKKPCQAIQPWAQVPKPLQNNNYPPQGPPIGQVGHHDQMQNVPFQHFQPPMQVVNAQIKPPVHQRLGYNNNVPVQFIPPPQPPQHQFEDERIVTMNVPYNQPPMFPQQPMHFQGGNYNNPVGFQNPVPFNQPPPQNNFAQQNYVPQWQPPPNQWQPPEQIPMHTNNMGYQHNHPPYPENNYIPPMESNFQQNPVQYNNNNQYNQPNHPIMQDRNVGYNNNYQNSRRVVHPPMQRESIPQNRKFLMKNSPIKRRNEINQGTDDVIKRRNQENTNLQEISTVDTTTPQLHENVVDPDEDEETKRYRLKIEEQKRKRQQYLAEKEERRKIAAQQKLIEEGKSIVPPKPTLKNAPLNAPHKMSVQQIINPNLKIINATNIIERNIIEDENKVEKQQLKSLLNNRKIIVKDQSLIDTPVVVVNNLAAGTTEVRLRKLCQGVGDIQNFELSPKERQATIHFKSVASAHAFYKKYQRFMLDLSMIKVSLKPLI